MPANLPPQYMETEKKLKTAETAEEKIAILDELLAMIPKHKGTEKLQAMLKTKRSKLKASAQKKASTAKHGPSRKVRKSGAGQVVVVGAPNAGKSMLIQSLTGINVQVSNYPFTTLEPLPVMMKYKNIQVQLVDTPPVSPDYMETWYPDIIRVADASIIVIDLSVTQPNPVETLKSIFDILKAKRIEFIRDDRERPSEIGWSYKKTLIVTNKNDSPLAAENLDALKKHLDSNYKILSVSAQTGEGLEDLKNSIYSMLNIIRVYSKIPGKKADLNDPFTLPVGSTVMEMARVVHKDFAVKLRFARIWGENAYDGQRVNRNHVLQDEDIIELHI
jgi:small GTP-binding protein